MDLTRTTQLGVTSSHTFLLYLTNCEEGGETSLLTHVSQESTPEDRIVDVKPIKGNFDYFFTRELHAPLLKVIHLAIILQVTRIYYGNVGRLLLFPHMCPHEGRLVKTLPKYLLRGELLDVDVSAAAEATASLPSGGLPIIS